MDRGTAAPLANFLENRKAILKITDGDRLEGEGMQNVQVEIARTESSRRRNAAQGKLLLVALLENYCMLYDQSKEQNQQLFFMLCQYLARMGIIDSTDFLEEFTSVRSSYKKAFKELVVKALQAVKEMDEAKRDLLKGATTSPQIDAVTGAELLPMVPSPSIGARMKLLHNNVPIDITELLDTNTSRFQEEFQQISILGKGAFGRVLHVRNVMDSKHYAVKVIKTGSAGSSELAKILREVKLLADIEHQNIVRYYGSWFQFTSTPSLNEGDDESEEGSSFSETTDPITSPSIIDASLHTSYNRHPKLDSLPNSKPLTLFIQMELCESTLHDWMEELNRECCNDFRRIEGKILYCFVDLLQGIKCIHDKSYIHRDIKPGNIYWKSSHQGPGSTINLGGRNGSWKIGDFGLATWIANSLDALTAKQQQSYGIGTFTYASPEQLREPIDFDGSNYSYQTDVYSLGIILFELLHPFGSAMERAKVLQQLRNHIVPEEFVTALPKEAALILWMMSPNPETRPTIDDIFKLEWFSQPQEATNLDNTGESKSQISSLKTQLSVAYERITVLEEENQSLKKQLALLQMSS